MWSKVSVVFAAAALVVAPSAIGWTQAEAETAPVSLHGFADLSVKNDYITPRGLRVTSKGTTIQALDGLVLDFARSKSDLITDVAVTAGIWADFNPGYRPGNTEAFNEFDWFVGVSAKIGKDWTAGVQYVEFISPQEAFETERNLEFSLSFDDSAYLKTISFHPYAKLFYAMSGDSTVVLGKRGDTFDVELGVTPTVDLSSHHIPLVVSAPTWVTVGPEDYWGGGGNVGVFSTGIKVSHPLKFIPATAGHWSVYAGYQYYNFINDQLVAAEQLLNGRNSRDAGVWSLGVSMGF